MFFYLKFFITLRPETIDSVGVRFETTLALLRGKFIKRRRVFDVRDLLIKPFLRRSCDSLATLL